jgi:cytochrome b pre-mRNA-processing protein 3
MISGLFARLTGQPKRGQPLFDAAVAEARRPHWFAQGQVPDTLEGRFAMLSTVLALMIVRLEQSGPDGEAATVGLTERFVEAMDAEIRQMGLSDPKLGRQVRSLVGALATRIEHWRSAIGDGGDWTAAVLRSVYRGNSPGPEALAHSVAATRKLWLRLEQSDSLLEGKIE